MSRRSKLAIVLVLLAAVGAVGAVLVRPGLIRRRTAAVRAITVRVGHVDYPAFSEEIRLGPGEEKVIWDTAYSVRFAGFVPDFAMDPETGAVSSRSDRRINPASLLELYQGGAKLYEQWVVHTDPEVHQVRAPGFVFRVVRLD